MKQLNSLENALFRIGAVLMIVGLLVRLHNDMACLIIYGIGCALYALMQLLRIFGFRFCAQTSAQAATHQLCGALGFSIVHEHADIPLWHVPT